MVPRAATAPVLATVCCLAVACGGGGTQSPAPPSGNGTTDGGEQVTGSERLGWSQSAGDRAELDAYQYAAYVDGQRVSMATASCNASSDQLYDCSAPLPRMSAGRHSLELVAILNGFESARSVPIVLTVGSAQHFAQTAAGRAPHPSASRAGAKTALERRCTFDECYDVRTVADGLQDAHALASLPGGRFILASGDARLLTFDERGASDLRVDSPCRGSSRSRVSSIAPDARFVDSRLIYVAWSCESRGFPRELLVVRYRELNGTLGEGAPLLVETGVARRDAMIAAARDGRLTVAIPYEDGWDLVRLTSDGRVSRYGPTARPVLARRRSITAIASGGVRDVVFIATGRRIEAVETGGIVFENRGPIAALACSADGTSMFVAGDPSPRVLRRLPLSSGDVATDPPAPDVTELELGGDVTAVAAGVGGRIGVVSQAHGEGATGSLVQIHVPVRR